MDMEKKQFVANLCLTSVYNMLPGGGVNYQNGSLNSNNTFFRRGIRAG